MPTPTAPFILPARPVPWLATALFCVALVCNQAAVAAPSGTGDPVTRFLADKGLLGPAVSASAPGATGTDGADPIASFAKTPAPSLVQQMRDGASDMVITAMNFLGVPYKRGGNSAETGFDCSGFTRHIFEKSIGLILPRRADDQAQTSSLISVTRDELKPGDLVFFNTLKRTFSHVGIYVGEGKFIHSPRSGSEVRVEDMRLAYWNKRFTGARRAPQAGVSPTVSTSAPVPVKAPNAAPALSIYSGAN